MENAEEVYHFLEDFSKRKPKIIPQELNDYLLYVARTGDPVYQWSLVKSLFKEKLLNVITDFYETTPSIEIPPYPNVDPFNYDIMKNSLLERLDSFTSAPFTVQRICELLTFPRKQYNRIDKFMRAVEKNILVVSTREPGTQRHLEQENGDPLEPIVNGSDNNSEYNVDVEMEDMSSKENIEQRERLEPQPSSSDTQITVDDIEARLQAKKDTPMETLDKSVTEYESVTPPELNVTSDEECKPNNIPTASDKVSEPTNYEEKDKSVEATPKADVEMKPDEEPAKEPMDIPQIKVDDAEMTEQRLIDEAKETEKSAEIPSDPKTDQVAEDIQQATVDESSSDSNFKEETEPKAIPEVSTSSEESSSSDNTDGNSNSPKTDSEPNSDVQEESSQSDSNLELKAEETESNETVFKKESKTPEKNKENPVEKLVMESENYSISDVNSELPIPPAEPVKLQEPETEVAKSPEVIKEEKKEETPEEPKPEVTETGSSESKEE